jgi:hypothetical protein
MSSPALSPLCFKPALRDTDPRDPLEIANTFLSFKKLSYLLCRKMAPRFTFQPRDSAGFRFRSGRSF